MSDICTIRKSTLDGIAEAIQSKTGESGRMLPSEMAGKIEDLPSQPAKGLVFSEYGNDGYPHKAEFVGSWTSIPPNYLRYIGSNIGQIAYKVTHLDIPEGVTTMGHYGFFSTPNLRSISLPSTLTTLGEYCFYDTGLTSIEIPSGVTAIPTSCFNAAQSMTQVVMKGDIATIGRDAFRGMSVCDLFDFSHCTAVPQVETTSFDRHKSGCVIRIPLALSDQTLGAGNGWESATNWVALTNIVWEAV